MNARVFANTTSLSLTADLDGAEFVAPVILAFQTISLQFRPSKEIAGVGVRDNRAIRAVAARIGWPDADPTQGTFDLTISLGATDVEVAALPYNVTAAALKSAIDTALATPLAALVPCSVTDYEGGLRMVFADNTAAVEIACTDNALWPMSFVEIDEIEWDEGKAFILDLRQAPVAESIGALEMVPTAPSVEVSPAPGTQAGGDIDGYLINEIQKLVIPAEFAGGSFVLARDKKSAPLTSPPTLEQVEAALDAIADEGGSFVVTPAPSGVYIEFQGSMAGAAQDPIDVLVFESPGTEYLISLSTRTPGMRALMRNADAAGRVEVPLNLDFEIAHPVTEGVWVPKVIPLALTFGQPVATGDRNVSASLRYDQPLSKRDYGRHSTDALLVGNRAMKFTIGNGSSTSFPLAHNLVENPQTVTANATTDKLACVDHGYQDLDPITFTTSGTLPAPLVAGTVYWVRDAASDDFKVALTANGAALDLTDTGSGTHTARLKDGTTEGVTVEVWETGGDEERLSQGSYTVARTSLDVVTLSGFASTPTAGQYDVYIQTLGRPATYQGHTHGIDDTPEAKARIEALEARVAALEAGDFGGSVPVAPRISGTIMRALPRVWAIPRAREIPDDPGSLIGWTPFGEGSTLRDIRLLPAVHVAPEAVEALPATLPTPSVDYRDRVFYSSKERTDITGGLRAGQYAACDGRDWYRVARESDEETTWYPTLFGLECFRLSISPDELALRTRLDLAVGLELALYDPSRRPLDRRTVGRMSLLLERGVRTAQTTPAASNIDAHFTDAVVLARHDFDLTSVPVQKRFSLSVARAGDGTLTAHAGMFLSAPVVVSPPATADFSLRLRLARVDFEDLPLDARGVLAVRGLDVGMDGAPDNTLGVYTIG